MSRRKKTRHTQEGFSLPGQVTNEILHRGRNLSVKEFRKKHAHIRLTIGWDSGKIAISQNDNGGQNLIVSRSIQYQDHS